MSALKLVIALDRAVSFKDLAGHPVLADLATLVDRRGGRVSPPGVDPRVAQGRHMGRPLSTSPS